MYDRKIVDQALALIARGYPDYQVAAACEVSLGAIRHWKYGTRRSSEADRRRYNCPRCGDRPLDRRAYAYLLGLYLGDGHIAHAPKGVFRLEIACGDGWPGLRDAAEQAVAAVMPDNSVLRRKRPGCTMIGATSKHLPCLFPQHGPGMKHTRKIQLEPWQDEMVADFNEEFVRGLIHSDGCRSLNRVRHPLRSGDRWYEYPRYTFVNESADIRALFTQALDRLQIAWKQSNRKTISVARREAVARLDEFVGPKY